YRPELDTARLGHSQEKGFECGKSARQRRQAGTATDAIQVDVEGDPFALCLAETGNVLGRARECPFLHTEEGCAHAALEVLHLRGQRTQHGEEYCEAAGVVHSALAAIMTVHVCAEDHPLVGATG